MNVTATMYFRRNRKTGGIVRLHVRAEEYKHSWKSCWAVCEHGYESGEGSKSKALRDMAHPDEWCPHCAEIAKERAGRKDAV